MFKKNLVAFFFVLGPIGTMSMSEIWLGIIMDPSVVPVSLLCQLFNVLTLISKVEKKKQYKRKTAPLRAHDAM